MKHCLVFFLLLCIVGISSAEKSFELHLVIHQNDSVELLNFSVVDGQPSSFPTAGNDNYKFDIVLEDGQVPFTQGFQIGYYSEGFRGPNDTDRPDVGIRKWSEDWWGLPYFSKAKKIRLYHYDKKIFEYEIKESDKPATKQNEEGGGSQKQPICPLMPALAVLAIAYLSASKIKKQGEK